MHNPFKNISDDRQYMLKVIWKNMDIDVNRLHEFSDNTQAFYFKRLKLEKFDDKRYELFDTSNHVYFPVQNFMLCYAYNKDVRRLSLSIRYTSALNIYESQSKNIEKTGKMTITDENFEKVKEIISVCKKRRIPTTHQLKELYYEKVVEA